MTQKLVAVAIDSDGRIAPHAGRALQWRIYDLSETAAPNLVWTLVLTHSSCLHEWHIRGKGDRHPLHFVDVVIAASAGEGVRRRLQERNTELLTTIETNPDQAVADYRSGNLAAGLPHDHQTCPHP